MLTRLCYYGRMVLSFVGMNTRIFKNNFKKTETRNVPSELCVP